ncbi:hypothetical protein EJ05DRAFT_495318 [Pseudovirgaria hyperparasitica]|uniref:Uncharacterized protein n=1 Tax=Pseudovirgaria hyperparasitica TaxID=470096 RepID=A0A6A6WJJ7_9PEZI|nr:uncharacterized protein EJ05DRAFT_495318 [Pseudovirgaria hyperparasitica]KAF2762435.1 hypothetical protein EJ05DRAFT_495318 [Pseudovirgaria hyperparasitica]
MDLAESELRQSPPPPYGAFSYGTEYQYGEHYANQVPSAISYQRNDAVPQFPGDVPPSPHVAAANQVHINPAHGRFNSASSDVPPYARASAYEDLTKNGIPDPTDLLDNYFPFRDVSLDRPGSTAGVLKILNTPYDVTKNEIVAMLGRDAKIATYPSSSSYYGIHIMFDRSTGKTGEVLVELQSDEEAQNVAKSLERYSRRTGKARMCGNRVTSIEVVGQEELMALLFPKAKCCGWIGQYAHVRDPSEHESAFEGFMNTEELRQIVMHAQKPGKGQFGKNAPQRPYEALISVLQKFPWHQSDHITLAERDNIFNTVRDMVGLLVRQVCQESKHSGQFGLKLNQQLLNELVIVSCSEALFNPAQQRHLLDLTYGETQVNYPLPRLANWWPFEVLTYRPGVNEKLLEYYAILIKQATTSPDVNSPEELEQVRRMIPLMDTLPFGAFIMRYDENKFLIDCADIARMEEDIVTYLIRRVMDKAADYGIYIPNCHDIPDPHAGPDAMVPWAGDVY